jgi:hypothetical protein
VAGLLLNAYALDFDGNVEMWRLRRTDDAGKRDLEDQFGVALPVERPVPGGRSVGATTGPRRGSRDVSGSS